MPDGGVAEFLAALAESGAISEGAAYAAAGYIGTAETIAAIAVTAYSVYSTQDAQRRAQNQARDAYNASLRDRYVMVRGATEPRQIVLGRARVSGPMFFVQSYGANREHLVFCVALAAHEIDAIEQIYFDDLPVQLDTYGNVTGVVQKDTFSTTTPNATFTLVTQPQPATVAARAIYGTTIVPLTITGVNGVSVSVSGATAGLVGTVEITYTPNPSPFTNASTTGDSMQVSLPDTGSHTFTLTSTAVAGTVAVNFAYGSFDGGYLPVTVDVSVSGQQVTVSNPQINGAPPTPDQLPVQGSIAWSVPPTASSKARIRQHLGGSGQAADPDILAAFPGVWTNAHTATGIAYLVVELDYDPAAFPGGIPNVSALVRGAKVFDPRTGTTAWSDNPALLMRHYATSPLGGRLDASIIDDASVITAANVCDGTAVYVVDGQSYSRHLFRAGLAAKTNAKPQDVLNDIAQSMAGKWVFADGLMRIRPGAYSLPVLALDETWLHEGQQIQVQPKRARVDVVNVVTATFADENQSYQVVQMPRVAPDTYIAEDGSELPLDLTLSAVQFVGQAQHVAGCLLRDGRAGLTVSVLCNMKAFTVDVFDVIYVTLPRFGWAQKTFEVQATTWTVDGGIQLDLKETDPTVMQLGAAFLGFDPAQATRLPSPWRVATIANLSAASGTAQLLKQIDGTIVSRIKVQWSALADAAVLTAGKTEVRYGLVGTPDSTWSSVEVPGDVAQVYLAPVQDGAAYVIKARAKSLLAMGQWSAPILHVVVGKTAVPVDVAGLAAAAVAAGVRLTWTLDTEADYDSTELRIGNTWATGTKLFRGNASAFNWISPGAGTYTVLAKHWDTSGNQSTNANGVQVTVGADGTVTWQSLVNRPLDLFNMVVTPSFEGFALGATAGTWGGIVNSVSGVAWTRSLILTGRDMIEDNPIPVRAGERIYFAADLASRNAYPLNFGAVCYDASGGYTGFMVACGVPAGGGFSRVQGTVDMPANTVMFKPWLQIPTAPGTTASFALADNLYVGRAQQGATVGADWDSNLTGIPYASIYNNDDSVALGFSMEDWPAGQAFPSRWGLWAGGPAPIRETAIVREGKTAVRWQTNGQAAWGIVCTAAFTNTPLPAGTFLQGSVDIYLVSYASGQPGILARVYTSAGLDNTHLRETYIQPPSTATGTWQRVPWSLRTAPGERIYAIQIYLMPSPDGRAAASTCDIVIDNLIFALFDSSTDNTAISLNPNGTANGGPSGQITITGMGGGSLAFLNQAGTGDLVPNAATDVYAVQVASANVTAIIGSPDSLARYTQVASLTFTATATGKASLFYSGTVTYYNSGSSGGTAAWHYMIADASISGPGTAFNAANNGVVASDSCPLNASVVKSGTLTRTVAVTAGQTYTFGVFFGKFASGDSCSVGNVEFRAEVIKR